MKRMIFWVLCIQLAGIFLFQGNVAAPADKSQKPPQSNNGIGNGNSQQQTQGSGKVDPNMNGGSSGPTPQTSETPQQQDTSLDVSPNLTPEKSPGDSLQTGTVSPAPSPINDRKGKGNTETKDNGKPDVKGTGKLKEVQNICDLTDSADVPVEFQDTIVEVVLDQELEFTFSDIPKDKAKALELLYEKMPDYNEIDQLIARSVESKDLKKCKDQAKLNSVISKAREIKSEVKDDLELIARQVATGSSVCCPCKCSCNSGCRICPRFCCQNDNWWIKWKKYWDGNGIC